MTLENNHTFISPRNQKITRVDTRTHTKDAYGFDYPSISSLADAVMSQVDNEFPCCQFASGCSFDDIVWQQAIGSLMSLDHTHRGHDHRDDEHVLFSLIQAGLVDHQAFDLPHKWSTRSSRYSAVMAERLWVLHTAEKARNDRLESELHTLKGEVQLLSTHLLAVDRHSFDASNKVNEELKKDSVRLDRHRSCLNMIADKHNAAIKYISNMSSQQELHRLSLLALRENICLCNNRSDSAEAPVMSEPSLSPTLIRMVDTESGEMIVQPALEENVNPIPMPAPGLSHRSCCGPTRVVESTTTLQVITSEDKIEDCIVGAWQAQGGSRDNASILAGSESNGNSAGTCAEPVMESTRGPLVTLSPEARGYRLLSVMRAVSLMPNGTVLAHLHSSNLVGGELQLVFPLNQEDFDALVSGEMTAEIHPVVVSELVRSGVPDNVKEESGDDDGWVTDRSVLGLEVDS
ncbi:hypothetical protein BDM02DRAFT_3192701 [Thelephora ganbajun]|uniref:Uncharacterized protein n=1 Tax=Thelephora ganbajun TaxID=370292 RepID=A0ACB6YZS6_THEGA|nr:hypothetical protein BDM02DRAFT_3192701 [Thelephora ganbajun]